MCPKLQTLSRAPKLEAETVRLRTLDSDQARIGLFIVFILFIRRAYSAQQTVGLDDWRHEPSKVSVAKTLPGSIKGEICNRF